MRLQHLLSLFVGRRGAPIWLAFAAWAAQAATAPNPAPVEFNRDIRPILSDKCYTFV